MHNIIIRIPAAKVGGIQIQAPEFINHSKWNKPIMNLNQNDPDVLRKAEESVEEIGNYIITNITEPFCYRMQEDCGWYPAVEVYIGTAPAYYEDNVLYVMVLEEGDNQHLRQSKAPCLN